MQHEKDTPIIEFEPKPRAPVQLDMFLHYLPSADPYACCAVPEPANDNDPID